jgi:hypothetical protein
MVESSQYTSKRIGDKLPRMALTDNARDFWVATAAAAPVIALAGLVSITDAAGVAGTLKRALTESGPVGNVARSIRQARFYNIYVIIYCIINLVVQGSVLIAALLSLLNDSASIPGLWIIWLESVGFIYLLVIAMMAGRVGAARRQLEEARARAAAEEMANVIGSTFWESQLASKLQDLLASGEDQEDDA